MLKTVRIWVLFSSLVVASGWVLSWLHELNGFGYGIVFGLAAIAAVFWLLQVKSKSRKGPTAFLKKLRFRFKRPAPLLYLALAFLALAGGALYPPTNGSSAAYRIPRVMDWLAAGQWHWIHTLDVRMNIAGCGMEWFFAPLILMTRNDRLLFLPNWFSFLLLPGLIYSVFTRMRISNRVAWWWMWLLPSGWCFIMQAGSTINDSFAAVYALAAVDFGLRARKSGNEGDVWFSLLSTALATGVKQSDILLAVPGLIAILPSLRLLLSRPFSSALLCATCVLVSAFPMIVFDLIHTGSWSGVTKGAWGNAELTSPFWGLLGNLFCMTAQNLKPPVFPFSGAWNAAMKHFLETPFGAHFRQFEDFGRLSFGVGESGAALGAGVVVLALFSVFAACHYGRLVSRTQKREEIFLTFLKWAPWGMLPVFMAKVGTFENGRQFASQYILLFPLLLGLPGHSIAVRQIWWKVFALLVMTTAVGLLIVSRDRPLFPAQTVIARLDAKYPNSKFISAASRTYSETPAFERQRILLDEMLPKKEATLGYAAWIDGEAGSSLWLPFGSRKVRDVLPTDTEEELLSMGIHYVVLEDKLLETSHDTLDHWLGRYQAVIVTQWQFSEDPYGPPIRFYLVHLPLR